MNLGTKPGPAPLHPLRVQRANREQGLHPYLADKASEQGEVTLSQLQDPTGQIFVKSKRVGEGSSISLRKEHSRWSQLPGSKCSEVIIHPCLHQVTIPHDGDGAAARVVSAKGSKSPELSSLSGTQIPQLEGTMGPGRTLHGSQLSLCIRITRDTLKSPPMPRV